MGTQHSSAVKLGNSPLGLEGPLLGATADHARPEVASIPLAPRLLDQLQAKARQRGHDKPTVASFTDWSRR